MGDRDLPTARRCRRREPRGLQRLAGALRRVECHQDALDAAERSLELDPEIASNYRAHTSRIGALRSLGGEERLREAKRAGIAVIAIRPEDVYAIRALAVVHSRLDELGQSERLFRKADELDPDGTSRYLLDLARYATDPEATSLV